MTFILKGLLKILILNFKNNTHFDIIPQTTKQPAKLENKQKCIY